MAMAMAMVRSSTSRLLSTLRSSSSSPVALLLLPLSTHTSRPFSALPRAKDDPSLKETMEKLRNIGISAHIDSGKTTLTERILFYTGRIHEIHEVRGRDGVGAKMDSMDLEREKGITIQSAATYCTWNGYQINIIDTPGHVDFTIEVERALRVLDGAILVLCSVGGVQSQSITVDRQMRRYEVPRVAFINKLDRMGADPWKVLNQARAKLRHHSAAVQVPIGLEEDFQGLVDLVEMKAYFFHGASGEKIVTADIPANMEALVSEKRRELIEVVSEVDDELAESFLSDEPISSNDLKMAIRRATVSRKFVPVYMGSAFKNKGVQSLLDGVLDYLPCPTEVENHALDQNNSEEKVSLSGTPVGPLVALAFKLEEGRFGQLTYLRIYEGVIRRGDFIINVNTGKKIKVPRLVRMHSNEMEDIQEAHAGQIVAVFGVDCASGDTFTDGSVRYIMTSMNVPEPVMSLAVSPVSKDLGGQFSKALNRFQKEDPTFRVGLDPESGETIISGMGELHLDIYVERIRREYKVDAKVGKPRVNFRETVTQRAEFDYLHKKQSGGQGQYGRVCGYIEPLPADSAMKFEFENLIIGQAIPSGFIPAIEKGFKEAANSGSLIGRPVENIRVVLTDGASHAVDSSELAFKLASIYAFRKCYTEAKPVILEPVMLVELKVPMEFQGTVTGDINKRKGMIVGNDQDGDDTVIVAQVPLNNMFGYSTSLRSMTQGKGEFTMEYLEHSTVSQDVQMQLVNTYKADVPMMFFQVGAVNQMGADKSPGPDGFPMMFFQVFWEEIKGDFMNLMEEFYHNNLRLGMFNFAEVVLIPKREESKCVGDFRPISLINCSAKIIIKVLAIRLGSMMDSLINKTQTGFIKGRCILDCVATAEQVIHHCHKSNSKNFLLKLDFEKAYDSVDWECLLEALRGRGFGDKWIRWIKQCLHSSKTAISVNGRTGPSFPCKKGLRQGDPLSPLLFTIVADVLRGMMENCHRKGWITPVASSPTKQGCTILQYADDILLFGNGSITETICFRGVLYCFEAWSGLRINFHKSALVPITLSEAEAWEHATTLNCATEEFPIKYLGLPLKSGRLTKADWLPIIDRVEDRLSGWKGKSLSLGGRVVLINSVLSNLPIYYMSFFELPKWVIQRIDRIRKRFLWKGADSNKGGYHLIKWNIACMKKRHGGLGIMED